MALKMKPSPERHELAELIRKSIAIVAAMSPEERDAMHKAQRESWVRGEMAINRTDLQKEIDANLEFFKGKLSDLLKDHRDRYVLIKNQGIVGIYDTIRDARTSGDTLFKDRIYSIQKISDVAINLGVFSYANSIG